MIEIFSKWLHTETGNIYTVLAIANKYADREGWPVLVVYRDDEEHIWACAPEKFLKKRIPYEQ